MKAKFKEINCQLHCSYIEGDRNYAICMERGFYLEIIITILACPISYQSIVYYHKIWSRFSVFFKDIGTDFKDLSQFYMIYYVALLNGFVA